VNHISDIR